jgi:Na+/H+ antiporter NhaD/arsenite permease-like protein
MFVSGGLSALLTNDIICFAFTPVITVSALRAGLNPVPYLLGLAISANIGSAATIIGNPQNMLIGQLGRLLFGVPMLEILLLLEVSQIL